MDWALSHFVHDMEDFTEQDVFHCTCWLALEQLCATALHR